MTFLRGFELIVCDVGQAVCIAGYLKLWCASTKTYVAIETIVVIVTANRFHNVFVNAAVLHEEYERAAEKYFNELTVEYITLMVINNFN